MRASSRSRMRRLARFARLEAWERRVLLRALVLLPLSVVRLRRLGVRGAISLARNAASPGATSSAAQDAIAQRVAALVDIAARHGPFRVSCLPAAVTLHRLLREHGIQSDLRVGVKKSGTRLEAHAWVERQGCALLESPGIQERFIAFDAPVTPAEAAP